MEASEFLWKQNANLSLKARQLTKRKNNEPIKNYLLRVAEKKDKLRLQEEQKLLKKFRNQTIPLKF